LQEVRSTGASGACGRNISAQITDVELILIRDGLFIFPQRRYQQHDNLPSALRKQLTVYWQGSKAATCRYPSHQKRRGRTVWNGKLQRITKQVSEEIFWMNDTVVLVGEGTTDSFLRLKFVVGSS